MATAVLSPHASSLTAASEFSSTSEPLPPIHSGTRFYRSGHWWEVDTSASNQKQLFYKCRPVCDVESRYFERSEVLAALQAEELKLQAHMVASKGRGSGRVSSEPTALTAHQVSRSHYQHQPCPSPSEQNETVKLLVVGSKQGVMDVIQTLHSLRYARCDDWSPIQQGKKKGEFLSILIQKKPVLKVG